MTGPKNNRYSDLKIVAFPDKLRSFKEGRITAPIYVRVKPVNYCNHGCHWCVYKADRKDPTAENSPGPIENTMHTGMVEKDVIPRDKMSEILGDFRAMGVRAVTYSGGGEPLMYRDIVATMETTLKHDIDLSIITNGQLLNGIRADVLRHARWVRVSMDYCDGEQMARFRRVPARLFDEVIGNLKDFASVKDDSCDLGVNFIVHRNNNDRLFEIASTLKSIGVENVRFSPMWCQDFASYHDPILYTVRENLKRCQELIGDGFTVNSTYDVNNPAHGPDRGQTRCLFAQTVPVIGADQNVYTCHNKAYDPMGRIGSIKDQSFAKLWASDDTRKFFDRLNPKYDCRHQCANHHKVAIYNQLADASFDNFV